jgi:hypothetical protein
MKGKKFMYENSWSHIVIPGAHIRSEMTETTLVDLKKNLKYKRNSTDDEKFEK